ncbi:MAG: helix-turn-helix domain-containing protein [Candidatus Margulisiibacteriota bacterium]
MNLATVLRIQIRKLQLSDYELAMKSGVTKSGLSKILNGKTKNPSYDTLVALAGALDLNVHVLMDALPTKKQVPMLQKTEVSASIQQVPVVQLGDANRNSSPDFLRKKAYSFLATPVQGDTVFAVRLDRDQYPFMADQLALINPELEPNDGDFVLMRTAGVDAKLGRYTFFERQEAIVGLESGRDHWVEPLHDNREELLIGVVVQVVWVLVEG